MKRKLTEYQADKAKIQRMLDALSVLYYWPLLRAEAQRSLSEIVKEANSQGVEVVGTKYPGLWKTRRLK